VDRQGVETVYETFRQLILLTADKSWNRIVVIEVENDLYNTFWDNLLPVVRIKTFHLPYRMDHMLMMKRLRYVKVSIHIMMRLSGRSFTFKCNGK
jgi:hypothetical protein